MFRACFIDPFQETVGGRFAAQNLGKKRAAVLYDVANDYSVGLAGDGFGGSPQLVRVEALMAELDDVDVVAPSGAGDAAFQDGDGLLGDGCLGRRRSFF